MLTKKKLADKGITIEFIQSSSLTEEQLKSMAGDCTEETIVAIDDATMQTTSSKELAHLFTVARHFRTSIVVFWHTIFAPSPAARIIAQNVGYYFLLNSPKMHQQVTILGSQLGLRRVMQSAYDMEMQKPYGYILVDLVTNRKELRVRTNVLEQYQTVFCPTL